MCHTILDASEVMTLCVQHQKRIVDDVRFLFYLDFARHLTYPQVLTLAKLDARLLIVVPERVYVPSLLSQVMHIYEVELKAACIETKLRIGRSFGDMQIQNVMLDPGRLLQVRSSYYFTQTLNLWSTQVLPTRSNLLSRAYAWPLSPIHMLTTLSRS
jgi:hypothetical protein